MSKPAGIVQVIWTEKTDTFEVKSNLTKEGVIEIIDSFIRSQMGSGVDHTKAKKRKVYHITLGWYPDNDDITVKYDTGNKGLREGLLLAALDGLNRGTLEVSSD